MTRAGLDIGKEWGASWALGQSSAEQAFNTRGPRGREEGLLPQQGQGSRKGRQLTEAAEGMRQNSSSQTSGKKLRQDARKKMEKSPVTGTEVPGMNLIQKDRNQNVEPEMSGQQQGDGGGSNKTPTQGHCLPTLEVV